MLMGNYTHNIDDKGRVAVPFKFRAELGEKFVLSRGVNGCLFIFSLDQWEKFVASINSMPVGDAMELNRYFVGNAIEVEPDKQGRISIPQYHVKIADLSDKAVFVGTTLRVEIWNVDRWEHHDEFVEQDKIDRALGNMVLV